jgi:glycosyltransferase involved in cell wall biosynthesis
VRVLHVAETLDGGVGRYLSVLARAQVDAGWQVTVAAPADGPWREPLVAAGARHVVWQARPQPGIGTVGELMRLRAIRAGLGPDVLHLHSSKAGLVGRLAARGRTPTILQPHSWSFYAVSGPVRRATLAWERVGARWVDVVLCVSQAEADVAASEGIRARCVVIPNGVDLAAHQVATADQRAAARRRFGLDPAVPVVVCVGRLHRQKGQHRLLDAWPAVRAAVPRAELVLVGHGPDAESLLARAGDGVQLVGASAEVDTWFAAADVVAAPSTWEGMSLSLLEAMAAGRSVVVTDVPGMREVVRPGVGACVPLDDPGALAGALVERLQDPELAATEGAAGRAAVVRDHDQDQHMRKVLDLTRGLAG